MRPSLPFSRFLGLLLGLTLAATAWPEGTDPALESAISESAGIPLVQLFSPESNPGQGTLSYQKLGGQTEEIVFGAGTGHYLFGMIFAHDTLPEAIRGDFQRKEVIQLAFGTIPAKLADRVGQFGAATLMVARGERNQRLVPLRIPGGSEAPLPESGFFLFTSPSMPTQLSDEDKLKGTFFARGGSIALKTTSRPKNISVQARGKKVPFRVKSVVLDMQAALITPFSNEEHQLRGTVEFPLYWPVGPAGMALAKELAEKSFRTNNSLAVPSELQSGPSRSVTGKPGK